MRVPEPVSVLLETHGPGNVADEPLETTLRAAFDLTPRGIIEALDLRRPIYRQTATYGHFGRKASSWFAGATAITQDSAVLHGLISIHDRLFADHTEAFSHKPS